MHRGSNQMFQDSRRRQPTPAMEGGAAVVVVVVVVDVVGGGGADCVSRIVLASSCPYAATNAINVSLSTLEKIDASALMCTSGDVEEVEEEVEEVVEVEDGGGEQRFTISGGASFARFST
jgi:hypothetical protein